MFLQPIGRAGGVSRQPGWVWAHSRHGRNVAAWAELLRVL